MGSGMQDRAITSETLKTIERFNRAFNRYDVDGIMALMSDDCVFESTSLPVWPSPPVTLLDLQGYNYRL
jgi:ketosteroid isomerase-like protein